MQLSEEGDEKTRTLPLPLPLKSSTTVKLTHPPTTVTNHSNFLPLSPPPVHRGHIFRRASLLRFHPDSHASQGHKQRR